MQIRRILRDLPISRKIWATMFMVNLIALTAVVTIFSRLSSRVIIAQAQSASSQKLYGISEKLDMTLRDIVTFSKMAIADTALQEELVLLSSDGNPDGNPITYYETNMIISRILGSFIKPRTAIESMSILDSWGQDIYSTDGYSSFHSLSKDQVITISSELTPENHVVWGKPRQYPTRENYIWVIPLYMKIYNGYSGAPLGLLESTVPLSFFLNSILLDTDGTTEFFILNEDGMVLAHSGYLSVPGDLDSADVAFYRDFIAAPQVYGSALYEARDYANSGWMLVSVVPLDDVFAASNPLMIQFLFLGLLSLCVTSFISYAISIGITKPLRILEQYMSGFNNLEYPQHVPVHGNDEVGRLATVYNDMVDRIIAAIRQNNEEQKQIRQYEMALFQAQLNPHFLNNIMENISGLIELDRKEESLTLIRDAASFYRSVLTGMDMLVPLEKELENARLYLKIQNVRYDKRIHYHIACDSSIRYVPIVKLTIQPLLENAIMHGLREKSGTWEILVEGKREGSDAVLTVTDNGVGMDRQTVWRILDGTTDAFQGGRMKIGVYATDQRLKLAFGEMYGLEYFSEKGQGTCVRIRLPGKQGGADE